MEGKKDYTRSSLAGKEFTGDNSTRTMSSSSSSAVPLPPQSEKETDREQRDTERFQEFQRKRSQEQQKRVNEMENRDREAQQPTKDILTEDHLRAMVRFKLKRLENSKGSMIDDEADELLPSSHHVLFKMSDYVSFPKNISIMNQIFGRRMKSIDGYYLKGDDGRFLFIFHDFYSFTLISLSFLVLFAQYQLLNNLYDRSGTGQCEESLYFNSDDPSWEVVFLCVVYAAGQATEDFFIVVPYEIMGINLESYCMYVNQQVQNRSRVQRTFWMEAVVNFLNRHSKSSEKIDEKLAGDENDLHIATRFRVLADLIVAIIVSHANIVMVFFTVMVMGFQIAYSSGTIDMIQNFIAVEIVLHVNEVLPRMFWIKDLSPYRFRKSLFETWHELEETEAIPVYYKDKEGADTKRIRPSYAQMRTYVFSSFVFAMSLVLMIVTVNYRRRCSSNDDIGS